MKIECPICGVEYSENVKICNKCAFYSLNKVFCSEKEKMRWYVEVVEPFQKHYLENKKMIDMNHELNENVRQQREIIEILNEEVDTLNAKIQKGIYIRNESNKYIGKVIRAGVYAGKEMEWIIIKKVENIALLLHKGYGGQSYIKLPFHYDSSYVDWNTSWIKYWLQQFYEESFSAKEKMNIIDYGMGKIFLLDISQYSELVKICNKFSVNCDWWLRSVKKREKIYVAVVDANGEIKYEEPVNDKIGVRPVMWMKI